MRCSFFRCTGSTFVVVALSCVLCTGCWTPDPPPKTVKTLMEQVRDEKMHWDSDGQPPSSAYRRSHPSGRARTYAIKELGKLGLAAKQVVPELVRMFEQEDDWVTDDHMTIYYRSEIARTLGAIGAPEAIAPLIDMLKNRSLTPDPPYHASPTVPRWHTNKEPTTWGRRDKNGAGPQGIVMGLMLFPREHHQTIVQQLQEAKTEIEVCELNNDWALREIDRAFRFFRADRDTQAMVVKRLKVRGYWRIMDLLDKEPIEDL